MIRSTPTHHPPRGITMVIVLVALATATVLATAYLASRDNSTLIGQNALLTTSARAGSLNGLEVVAAMLETEADWRTEHTDGVLIDGLAIGDAVITVSLVDLLTDAPPTESTEYVRITSTAVSNGIVQEAMATAWVPPPGAEGTIDIDLGEFSVSTVEGIVMRDDAMITRWPAASRSKMKRKEPVRILSGSTNAGAVSLAVDSATIDTVIYTPPGASASLVHGSGVIDPRVHPLTDAIPMPAPAPPPVDTGSTDLGDVLVNFPISFASYPDATFRELTTAAGGVIQVTLPDVMTIEQDLQMGSYSRMLVAAPFELIVLGDLRLDPNSAIELLTDTATLDVWVGGDVIVDSAHIGAGTLPDLATRAATGTAPYFDSSRIRIRSIPGHEPENPQWILRGDSVVTAMLEAPDAAPMHIRDTAALYGNARTGRMELSGGGMLFYDPALDSRLGYTSNPNLWSGGSVIAAAKAMTSLSEEQMQLLAETAEYDVKNARKKEIKSAAKEAKKAEKEAEKAAKKAEKGKGDEEDEGGDPDLPDSSTPTPRPIPVEWNVEKTGSEQAETVRG